MPPTEPGQGPAPSPGSKQNNLPKPDVEVTGSTSTTSSTFVPPETGGNEIPATPAPAREASPYDFFMTNSAGKNSGTGVVLPQDPGKQFLLLVGGGAAVVIIILMLLVFIPKKDPKLSLINVDQAQTETLRVCEDGVQNAQFTAMRSFAENCSLVLTTQTTKLSAHLGKVGANIKGKVLTRGYNLKSTQALASSQDSSSYDSTFKTVIGGQLAVQMRALQTAYNDKGSSTAEKQLIKDYADQTKLLQQALNQN